MLNLFDNIFFVFCRIYKIKDFHMVFVLISFVLLRDRRMESSSKCLFIPISNVQKGLMGFFSDADLLLISGGRCFWIQHNL